MHYLENMADALLRWSESHTASRPLCIATARELLVLAESELKVKAMSRFAGKDLDDPNGYDLQSLYNTLRDSTRDISEIRRSLSSSSPKDDEADSSNMAEMAIRKLSRLANTADAIGDHDLADGLDDILVGIFGD